MQLSPQADDHDVNATLTDSFDLEGLDTPLKPHVQMLLIYDDVQTGQQALDLYKRLVRQLGSDYVLHAQGLSFESLHDPQTRQWAAQQAVDADMIAVSARAERQLPAELTRYLELWLDQRTETPQALIALLCTSAAERATESPLYVFLRRAAEDANIEFFHQAFAPMTPQNDLTAEFFTDMEHPIQTSRRLEEMLQRSYPVRRWGLNE